jgi:hypothetical protein
MLDIAPILNDVVLGLHLRATIRHGFTARSSYVAEASCRRSYRVSADVSRACNSETLDFAIDCHPYWAHAEDQIIASS